MAINSVDQWLASNRQRVRICKTTARTSVALNTFHMFELGGNPGAGTNNGTNTANGGAIQTDATAGYPDVSFSTGIGYLTKVEFGNTVAGRLSLFDRLVKMGPINYNNAAITPTADTQPDITGRCPDYPGSGSVYGARNELWFEALGTFTSATAFTVTVTYRNQAGTSGRSATMPTQAAAALTLGKMIQLSLQSGDTGVQRIEGVTVTTGAAAAGTFNINIMRSLWTQGRVPIAGGGDIHDIFKTGAPQVYGDSAIMPLVVTDSGTSSGLPEVSFDICNA
jgi:hypothetical protein